MKTQIRKMEQGDIKALRKIYLSVRRNTFTWVKSGRFAEEDFDKETEEEKITVAFSGETIVGFISVWEPESFIHHLYILPEYQNKGVGKLLLYHAIKALNAPIRLKCLKKNTRALKFYEINGWKFNEAGKDVLGEYVLLEFSNELRY